ncbi:hypothetical protein [Rubellicoccus peritrichatus]|uniref:Uncharacterized protein n=1 Tax=Rubellicoccus peritrichatus TaxID=3080537 RepID=A0AAQ3QY04_9BACT|nr:hypothetical protein [Puniceicoccus sp. CR14]WOO43592.1 hypothetical protein RZN69_10880 [Puniceicoccus sp. CR14]
MSLLFFGAIANAGITPGSNSSIATEVFELETGWNAIEPTIEPDQPEADIIFADLPVGAQVYAYFPNENPSSFVNDGAKPVWRGGSWSRWTNLAPDNELNDLGGVVAKIPLIIYTPEPATLTLDGVPVATVPDDGVYEFDLRALAVNPDGEVTFEDFFLGGTMPKAVFDLDDGHWREIPLDTVIQHGRAYWFYHEDAVSYEGVINFRNLRRDGVSLGSGFATVDYQGTTDGVGLVLEKVSGDLAVEFGDGFLADGFTALDSTHELTAVGTPFVSRLQFRISDNNSSGHALIEITDSFGIIGRYVLIQR